MILKPPTSQPKNETPADLILRDAGIIRAGKKGDTAQDSLRKALSANGGTLDDVAETLTDLMRGAENENVRISAAKMIAVAQGALSELNDAPPPIINIEIVGNQGQVALNILMPRSREQVNATA